MNKKNLPVLLITWNRPRHLLKSYKAILDSGIDEIFIYCDGLTVDLNKNIKINETRNLIKHLCLKNNTIKHKIKFASQISLGCREGVTSAINWFFEHNEKGIIVEDDVIISKIFPAFCLNYFSISEHVQFISASNYGIKPSNGGNFRLSRHAYIWGWATTSKLWSKYEKYIDEIRIKEILKNNYKNKNYKKYIKFLCEKCILTNNNKIDTWDYQLSFLLFEQNIINLVPSVSLAKNIGFDSEATHTKEKTPEYAKLLNNFIHLESSVDINLIDFKADKSVQDLIYLPSLGERIKTKLFKYLK